MTDLNLAPTRIVHTRVPKTSDIEIHVSTLETAHGEFTDIREFVVSLEQYGRGITFPAELTGRVLGDFLAQSPDLIEAFRAGWESANERGEDGHRVEAGFRALGGLT